MNSLDGYTFCTLCSQYTPEGTACSDPDCPVVDADPSSNIHEIMDEVEPIDFRNWENLRDEDYILDNDFYLGDDEARVSDDPELVDA